MAARLRTSRGPVPCVGAEETGGRGSTGDVVTVSGRNSNVGHSRKLRSNRKTADGRRRHMRIVFMKIGKGS